MKTYSAAIFVEFTAANDAVARMEQDFLAGVLLGYHNVVYTDTIGPPECIEGCNESETG